MPMLPRLRQSPPCPTEGDFAEALETADARVTFTASGPFGLRVRGRGKEVRCCSDGKAFVFSVPLGGIKTGISLRDKAMHELLGTRRFPTVELRVARPDVTIPASARSAEGEVEGTLRLRGKSAPIDVAYQIKRSGEKLDVTGSIRIPIETWGISLPRHMGFGLKSQVAVKVVFSVSAQGIGL